MHSHHQQWALFSVGPAVIFVRNAAENTLLDVIGQKPKDGLGAGAALCPKVHQPTHVTHENVGISGSQKRRNLLTINEIY